MPVSFVASKEYALEMDQADPLFSFRSRFLIPKLEGRDVHYFCGNSLGLQPQSVRYLMQQELEDWAHYGVEGHFDARRPWFSYHQLFSERLSQLVGASKEEVVAMNSLTVNLHLLMASFYRPTAQRYKIIMEAGAFPSDQYAMESQARFHGLDPADAIIEVSPRPGAHLLEEEDILVAIEAAGDTLALVLIGGVNYYTGQYFNLKDITAAAHRAGAYAGFDLAHAIGNVPLKLREWDVDFACWCSYKYLNSGPGGVGGAYVHIKHASNPNLVRLAGWWGNDEQTRFKMEKGFVPKPTAESWQLSNAPVFNMVAHHAALDIFEKAGMDALQEKSRHLTGYLEFLLRQIKHLNFTILTPAEPERRGAQLSLLFHENGRQVFDALSKAGIVADWREPDVIRVAPVPLYNTYEDAYALYEAMLQIS